ncbi:MAG: hypothetical protein H6605_02965 [Flavobacteriales bacterium]|nr:hypothetical protein [Flavobacteriales bacterium]
MIKIIIRSSVPNKHIFTLLGLILSLNAASQTGNQKEVVLIPGTSFYQLDSLYSVDTSGFEFYNKEQINIKPEYTFDLRSGKLMLVTEIKDTLKLYYRSLPVTFRENFFRKPASLIESALRKDPFAYDPLRDGIFNSLDNSLKTDGNISRGLSGGNNQDLVVNSNLNLRLGGKLADDVEITGVISDDNNPIQPEGNTQQLQDFDKVFIRLTKDSNNLIVGDFEMIAPEAYFMNYYKKSRGVHLDYKKLMSQTMARVNVDAAISRGRFARNTIQGIEGNQGPYRLSGNNGEIFLIVISGTEVVYLDGRRLSRGESKDYVINYNTGEITFMPTQMINRFSRIVVEFQYSDRNYQRTVLKTGLGLQRRKTLFEINYFVEQDNKNQNFQQSLDGYDSAKMLSARQILANAGDNIENASIPRVRYFPEFDNTKLLYTKKDTVGFGSIFIFAENETAYSQFYEVVFSFVGNGNGNYRQKNSTANGRVYEWVGPVNGVLQGSYEPVEILVAPKRYQMLTIGAKTEYKNTKLFMEGVYTNNNLNTFSALDKSNDDGFGLVLGLENTKELRSSKNKYTVRNALKTEMVNRDFRYLERYRAVEFERNWNKQYNIPSIASFDLPEIIGSYNLALEQKDKFKINYQAGLYYRSSETSGLSNLVSGEYSFKKLRLFGNYEKMLNEVMFDTSSLKNNYGDLSAGLVQNFKPGNVGLKYRQEKSEFSSTGDSLYANSFSYRSAEVFFESRDTTKFTYGIRANRRMDNLPYSGNFKASTLADELSWKAGYSGKNNSRVSLNGTYRKLEYLDSLVVKGVSEENALGRVETNFPLFKNSVIFNGYYQIGTGQEQQREYTYIRVSDGNGVYIWNDYDSNNVQSQNEFEIASDYDKKRANFLRTSLPVQGFIKSRNLEFNQSLNLRAPLSWNRKKGVLKTLTRFSGLMVFRSDRKTTSTDPSDYLSPFQTGLEDQNLISSNSNFRSTLFINRNHPKWSLDISRLNGLTKLLLVNGIETRKNKQYTLNGRINYNRKWGTVIQVISGDKSYYSQFLLARNYSYSFHSAEPQLQFTSRSSNFGVAFVGKYYKAIADTLQSQNLEGGLDLRISKAARGSFTGGFRLVQIRYNGDPSSPLGYELMKGLLPGKNYTWNLVYQQRISTNIQMDVSYDGRKSELSKVIHIGRVIARYLF